MGLKTAVPSAISIRAGMSSISVGRIIGPPERGVELPSGSGRRHPRDRSRISIAFGTDLRQSTMTLSAWERLLDRAPWFRKPGAYPLPAYSEFMPAVQLGPSPYGGSNLVPRPDDDDWGWAVSEWEEAFELRP